MNIFSKLTELKNTVEKDMGKLPDLVLFQMVQKLANKWHYPKTRKGIALTKEEAQLYEILLSNKYNPSTVYKWLLLVKVPQEMREKVKHGLVTQKEAWDMKGDYKQYFNVTERQFVNNIKDAIERYLIR